MTATTTAPKPTIEVSTMAKTLNPIGFKVEPRDVELFNKYLRSFVPPKSFDPHHHHFDLAHLSPGSPPDAFGGPSPVDYPAVLRCQTSWMGDRHLDDGLFFPFPQKGRDSSLSNGFLTGEFKKARGSRGLMMIS